MFAAGAAAVLRCKQVGSDTLGVVTIQRCYWCLGFILPGIVNVANLPWFRKNFVLPSFDVLIASLFGIVFQRLYFYAAVPFVVLLLLLYLTTPFIGLSVLMDFCCLLFSFLPLLFSLVVILDCALNGFMSSAARFPALWFCRYGAGYSFCPFLKCLPAWILSHCWLGKFTFVTPSPSAFVSRRCSTSLFLLQFHAGLPTQR